jgi:putative Holliday junction resolvase
VAQELAGLASAHGARRVVIGYPLNMNGSVGDKAAAAAELAATLGAVLDSTHQGLGADVVLQDERRTTVQAAAQLRSAGRKAKAQRRVIDQAAAVVILQAAIDSPH